jgi:hypothetical protein
MADVPDAVFHADGSRFVPTELARGPWSADAQHGGGPAALLARAVERADPSAASFVSRITVELMRPVPLTPLEISVRTTRPGKKVQWLEATMSADGTEVARAHALRLRTADPGLPQIATHDPLPIGPADAPLVEIAPPMQRGVPDVGFWTAMELRRVSGSWTEPGPAAVWFRLRVPMVAGEAPSPLQRVAAAADFGNGISAALERGAYLFINADLTIYLHRPAGGEWVGLDAVTAVEPTGIGLATSVLHDEKGGIGRSLQSLLVDHLR